MDQLHLFSVFVAVVDANGFAGAARKLQQRGVPQRPEDLAAHDIVSASAVASGAEWRLVKAGAPCVVKLQPGMISTTSEAALAAAVGGFGLTRLLSYQVADRLRDGPLKIVLGDFEPAALCRCTWSIAKAATRRGRRASCWTWRSSACVPIRPCSRFWLRRACQRTSVARDWALALLQGGRKFPPAGRRLLQRPGHCAACRVAGRLVVGRGPLLRRRMATGLVEGFVPQDPDQPGPQGRSAGETRQALRRSEHSLRTSVFGPCRIAQHPARHAHPHRLCGRHLVVQVHGVAIEVIAD